MKQQAPVLLTVALALSGCADKTGASTVMEGELQLELRETATLRMTLNPEKPRACEIHLQASAAYGLLPTTEIHAQQCRILQPNEAHFRLYSARFSAPASLGGPCGDQPISLALSLHREGSNQVVVGGISAYCGADRWYGKPVRVLRLFGNLLPQ
jgi:hypothetical protein